MRTLNKDNPKNIYCAHCEHYIYEQSKNLCWCDAKKTVINYWNRCKDFIWAARYDLKDGEKTAGD